MDKKSRWYKIGISNVGERQNNKLKVKKKSLSVIYTKHYDRKRELTF